MSVKDTYKVKGQEASSGYVSFLGKKAEANSHIVEMMLELGAVVYVKTNIPQTVAVSGYLARPSLTFLLLDLYSHRRAIRITTSSGGH